MCPLAQGQPRSCRVTDSVLKVEPSRRRSRDEHGSRRSAGGGSGPSAGRSQPRAPRGTDVAPIGTDRPAVLLYLSLARRPPARHGGRSNPGPHCRTRQRRRQRDRPHNPTALTTTPRRPQGSSSRPPDTSGCARAAQRDRTHQGHRLTQHLRPTHTCATADGVVRIAEPYLPDARIAVVGSQRLRRLRRGRAPAPGRPRSNALRRRGRPAPPPRRRRPLDHG